MKRIRLYRHRDCVLCGKVAKVHAAFDWLGRLDCTTDPAPGGPLRLGEIEAEDIRTGAIFKGIDAVRAVARQVPAYYPLLPLLWLPPIARRIDRQTRGCEGGSCGLPESPPRQEAATHA